MKIHLCSHAQHLGHGRDSQGKLWHWEFHPYLGPIFINGHGKALTRQPKNANHRAWRPFNAWLTHRKLTGEIK